MPKFLFFCHRFFELRFIVATGILDHLTEHGEVALLLPEDLAKSFQPVLEKNKKIKIAISNYTAPASPFRRVWLNFWGDVLYLAFPNTDKRPNATAEFHRQYYRSSSALKEKIVVGLSRLASRFSWLLNMSVWLYQSVLPARFHDDLLQKEKPDLMIGCSFGLSVEDAAFLKEARINNIPSAVLVQSWDRTSNKGYPTVRPDHALVWNNIMAEESIVNLGFAPDRVHVVGSPLWDKHFKTLDQKRSEEWRKDLGIQKDSKILFFACGGFGNHPANMIVIPKVFDLAEVQPFSDTIHIVFRMYPQYLSPITKSGEGKRKKDEIERLLRKYKNSKYISILCPKVDFDGKNFVPNDEDHDYMTECLYQCDVSLSQVSSQMIEACIFDKPALNIEFGRRQTDKYDLEIADYKTEHLLRLYRTGAIDRVQDPADLEKTIAMALQNPAEKSKQRQQLVDQEAPLNRGSSASEAARCLAGLVGVKKTVQTRK